MMSQAWEYRDLYEPSNEDVAQAGLEGWEAFAVTMQHRSNGMYEPGDREVEAWHFKRPKLPSYIAVTGMIP